MGQLWVTDSLGGFLGNAKLSKELRFAAQPMMKFRQFCQVKGALGKNRNDTLVFNKARNISTQGGTLVETDTIPERQFTIGQGTLTITEYGNAIPYTGKLDALAEFDVDNAITVTIRNDMAKVIDLAVSDEFLACELKYAAIATTSYDLTTEASGTATETATTGLDEYHVRSIVDLLKKGNVPTYDGKDYFCIASIDALSSLKSAPDWVDAVKYGDPERLFSGEVGRFYGCRFMEENNVLANTMGINADQGEAVFFGNDACMEGIAIPEELRAKIPTDYGRSQGVAWYGLMGWQKIWDVAADAEPHLIHFNAF